MPKIIIIKKQKMFNWNKVPEKLTDSSVFVDSFLCLSVYPEYDTIFVAFLLHPRWFPAQTTTGYTFFALSVLCSPYYSLITDFPSKFMPVWYKINHPPIKYK